MSDKSLTNEKDGEVKLKPPFHKSGAGRNVHGAHHKLKREGL